MGFFNKLKEQAFERAKEEMLNSLGASLGDLVGGGGDGGGGGGGDGHMTKDEYEATKPDELRKDIRMISGCQDRQTSADVSNVSSFQLPDPAGELFVPQYDIVCCFSDVQRKNLFSYCATSSNQSTIHIAMMRVSFKAALEEHALPLYSKSSTLMNRSLRTI